MSHAALLLAAGRGSRMAGAVADKVLAPVGGRAVFAYSVEAFAASGCVGHLVVVYRDAEQKAALEAVLADCELGCLSVDWVPGGAERQNSVYAGLSALPCPTELVFIHDAARPLITPEQIARLEKAAQQDDAAVLAHRVVDTIKQVDGTDKSCERARLTDLERSRLWAMETPQVFKSTLIREAYEQLRAEQRTVTDDTAAVSALGHGVTLVENREPNPKVTTPGDLAYVAFLLQNRQNGKRGAGASV